MRTKIHKLFLVWNFKKEEQWLNDMAAQGKALVRVAFGAYEFEDCQPGEYVIRLEMLDNGLCTEKGKEYIRFVEGTGAEQVGSMMRWVYFRKKAALGSFELMGDNATRIKHLKGIICMLIPVALLNFLNALNSINLGNTAVGVLCAALATLLVYGIFRLNAQKKALEKDAQLYE